MNSGYISYIYVIHTIWCFVWKNRNVRTLQVYLKLTEISGDPLPTVRRNPGNHGNTTIMEMLVSDLHVTDVNE